MIRKRIILQLISFSLNVFFLIYILNTYVRRKKPTFKGCHLDNIRLFEQSNESSKWECTDWWNNKKHFRITQRGRFFVLNNYVQSSKKFNYNESITYVTHADYTFLENLITLAERWDGPVSVAVHAPGSDFSHALSSIIYLRSCGPPKLRELVTFHLYFPDGNFPREIPRPQEIDSARVECNIPPRRGNPDRNAYPYPINIGRNVARENSVTRYILVSDIELFPSIGLAEKFLRFVSSRIPAGKLTVYPIPVFELISGTEIPRNKTELVKMTRVGKAQIFHKRICSYCHRIPNLGKWLEKKESDELNVFQVAKRVDDLVEWEPIFIGTNEEPFYDERLSWEGKRDKMTQGYIMCVLDYEFHILDNAFLIHKPGMKKLENNMVREYIVGKTLEKIEKVILPQLKTLFGKREGCKLF